ncbi:hypothetical protein QDQ65_15340 [Klebsiella aerogenes]|uniref:hypothetical protein n=1 Tax=Klebsiella aerogenes TaxID=548 RepID=UPI0029D46442|nr:hypothetical protein [Klebsiella aerogenes]MDX7184856.1 hypothetical protein [Klebsiella aerogenes]
MEGEKLSQKATTIDTVRASRAGHTFHERWTARRALQLVFPKDDLFALAVEGLSTNETASPGEEAVDIADLILYFGDGDTFESCRAFQTLQFKYKVDSKPVTCSYLKKTIKKFAATLQGYEKDFSRADIDEKLSFAIVTNTEFSSQLWEAIHCLNSGDQPKTPMAQDQFNNLKLWCQEEGVEASRLFSLIDFQAATKDLAAQNRSLRKILGDWTPGVDSQARMRLHGLEELVREKAGLSGQRNNLITREDVLDALGCEPEDLFPANTEFVDVGAVIEREVLHDAQKLINSAEYPILIHADGGVGKTVFIQSLAHYMEPEFETVIFDCFGGGSYRAEDQARHLPKIGLLQIVNELASRGLCDPQLPSDGDQIALIRAARKRLKQAADTVKSQTTKQGVLVIIDAADNAQLEADYRKEHAFPRLLLASLNREPVDGVKLVLTSRSHRMNGVIEKSQVELFELPAFSDNETRQFLVSRRDELTEIDFSTAFSRSGGNGRVLDYLVSSWDENITGNASKGKITVEELINQRCIQIRNYLHFAGWDDSEITQFFVAISLLPPPIPLDEMADALGWSRSKVNSAVTDLAPMLELQMHGAIFRDEPTETFIRETYGKEKKAQGDIADRLYAHQVSSAYAAEALPHFLVVIDDVKRAYELSNSTEYPASLQSEYGRRRLKLLRLRAAFVLAIKAKDLNRVHRLAMELAQVSAAKEKGDSFIRRSPSMSVLLGDQDASRRLFQDRSGWRGARDARLTIAFAFQGEMEEAEIHQNRTLGWINWHYQNHGDEDRMYRENPEPFDFAALFFISLLKGDFVRLESNIVTITGWSFRLALSVCQHIISLAGQHDVFHGHHIMRELAKFAASKMCESLALQVCLLASKKYLTTQELDALSRATANTIKNTGREVFDGAYDHEQNQQGVLCDATLSALVNGSYQSALALYRANNVERISSYNYKDRHGPFKARTPILSACLQAWTKGQKICFYHLLPREVKINRIARTISNCSDLSRFLSQLLQAPSIKDRKKTTGKLFSDYDSKKIAECIELVKLLAEPLERAILSRREIDEADFHDYIELWKSKLRFDIHWRAEDVQDNIGRNVGLMFVQLLLQHAVNVSVVDCHSLIDLLCRGKFTVTDKLEVLRLIVKYNNLKEQCGLFAQEISKDICKDESIEQRANQYSLLSATLLPIGIQEARQYYRDGLSQLDQIGGDDYDSVYSILRYATEQHGCWIAPALGHRLMNLCQTIFQYEPSKFDWALFGLASAKTIGYQAIYKIIRWADQDIADFSYGLPQLVCYLAKEHKLDARRAAVILIICEDHGWYNWKIGDGLKDILDSSDKVYHSVIVQAFISKLLLENPLGAHETLWKNINDSIGGYSDSIDYNILDTLNCLYEKAHLKRNSEGVSHRSFEIGHSLENKKHDENENNEAIQAFEQIIQECDLAFPQSIDMAIRTVSESKNFRFSTIKSVIETLRIRCPYERRMEFINMLVELNELNFHQAFDEIKLSVEMWGKSTASISAARKDFIKKLFENRGSDLFEQKYSKVLNEIFRLTKFCNDGLFIAELVLNTITKENIELAGDEWIDIATSLIPYTSSETHLQALEGLLSSSAAKMGDEIGEGSFKDHFVPKEYQDSIIPEVLWHFLGNGKTFLRWNAARSVKNLVELSLHDDIIALLDYFDKEMIDTLVSKDMDFSFLNAGEWLLIGLSRACFYYGASLSYLTSRLEVLAKRDDIHIVNKIHILRCLKRIDPSSSFINDLEEMIYIPVRGYVVRDDWPENKPSKSNFHFDYDFNKYEIDNLAGLFGISNGEATDALVTEINKRWPEASDLNYFHGRYRYHGSNSEQYESFRESIQRHALLFAASELIKSHPVIMRSYECSDSCPWTEWLKKFDVTFDEGMWLTDLKDEVADLSQETLIIRTENKKIETLEHDEALLRKIGLHESADKLYFPIYGTWSSADNVHVRVVSALAPAKGIIGKTREFSQNNDHDIWLPVFDTDGEPGRFFRKSDFKPLIWQPENYSIGIDSGDEYATRYAAKRSRLGKAITQALSLQSSKDFRKWFTKEGNIALKSQVWGQWKRDPENHRSWFQDEDQILWANSEWLDETLKKLNRALIFHVVFYRYKSIKSYDDSQEIRAVFVGCRQSNGKFRFWRAKRASKLTR